MSLESKITKDVANAGRQAVRTVEKLAHKAWSIMDAAAEKSRPTDYLSQQAVKSIQGKM